MPEMIPLKPLTQPPRTVYDLPGFRPSVVDRAYLAALGVAVTPSDTTLRALERGSSILKERLEKKTLIPRPRMDADSINPDSQLEIHNYTGACPTLTFEINPVSGCHVGCLYCLVTDGSHEPELVLHENYPALVERVLAEKREERHFFYFSPKTEAFQEPTLQSGVAHEILRVFIAHFAKYPRSGARLFVASKAGTEQLRYNHGGESVLDLFARLKGRMQFNTSLSIMPEPLRLLLEPGAATLDGRLEAVRLCRERGIAADSALVQPIILPYLNDAHIEEFFDKLAAAGIVNFKLEFLTVNMENLALIGQILGYHDKAMERELYEAYIAPGNADHKKQRDRTAPDRKRSVAGLRRLVAAADKRNISTSICFWLRKELALTEEFIPTVNRNGYQCLGYQTRLFEDLP